jgi:DNA-binding IclR family transcriptional regulator
MGYALDNEEYLSGIKGIAVNLGNCRGLPLIIWVVGFAATITDDKIPGMVAKILAAAREIVQLQAGNNGKDA